MSTWKLIGYGLIFAATAVVLVIGMNVPGQTLFRPLTVGVQIAIAVGVALVLSLIYAGIDLGLMQDQTALEPLRVARDFNQRADGVMDTQALANVVGTMLADRLRIKHSVWLLISPAQVNLALQAVNSHGPAPVEPLIFSRSNPLIRTLDTDRQPITQKELEADPRFRQMVPAEQEWLSKLGTAAYVPVFDSGILTAILAVGPRGLRGGLSRSDLHIANIIASQAAATLKTTRAVTEIRAASASMASLLEDLKQKNEAIVRMENSRSDFLAIASHELRTPITQMLGFADLLGSMVHDDSLDKETVAQVTDSIVRACGRLNEVINQILDMSQLDLNAMDLRFTTCELSHLLQQAIEPFAHAMRERRLGLKITGLKNLPPLQADEQRLTQAFSQLMSNAIKYTPDGGKIDITLRLLPPENGLPPQIEIVFIDAGIGIDPQHHDLIFEKFQRIGSSSQHSTSTTRFLGAGPGLGLPIAKGVVERHGGRLWVESQGHDPAKFPGSRFYIVLPIRPPAFDPRALEADALASGAEAAKETRTALPRANPFVDV